jgi:hypothetical protein
MSKSKEDPIDKILKEKQEIHDKLVDKRVKEVNELSKKERYTDINEYLVDTRIGEKYRNFVSDKYDGLDSKIQSKYNKSYHKMDNKIYDLNNKLDRKDKLADHKLNKELNKLKKYDDIKFD